MFLSSLRVRLVVLAALAALIFTGSLRSEVARTDGRIAAGTKWETPYYVVDSGVEGPTLLVTGGLHGNEPAGYRAAEQIRRWTLRRGRLVVAPRVNSPGLEQHSRWMPGEPEATRNANRNFPKTGQPNVARSVLIKALWAFMERQKPEWVIDLHEGFDFHIANSQSDGSSIIYFDGPRMRAIAARLQEEVNAEIRDPKRKIVRLSKSGPIDGGLVRAAVERLGARGFCFETTYRMQPLSTRTRQLRILVHGLMRELDMAAGGAHVMTGSGERGPIDAALYDAEGAAEKGLNNMERVLDASPAITLNHVGPADIQSGVLDQFDIVVFPGGSGSKQARAIGPSGLQAVRAFVRGGGGYLGVCAGAYLATARYPWSLGLLNARTFTGNREIPGVGVKSMWFRGAGNVEMELTDQGKGIFGDRSGPAAVHYENGPVLSPAGIESLPPYTTLAFFRSEIWKYSPQKGTMVDTPAIIAAPFGNGRAMAISPHPEATEGLAPLVVRAVTWAAGAREKLAPQPEIHAAGAR